MSMYDLTIFLKESLVFSKNDYTYNFENWTQDKVKILFIMGLCGSGKSTIAKKIAKKYNAEYIELDVLTLPEGDGENKINILKYLVEKSKSIKLVVDGIKIRKFPFELIKNQAFFIKNTSLSTSSYRTIIRNLTDKENRQRHGFNPFYLTSANIRIFNSVEEFKKKLDDYYDSVGVPKETVSLEEKAILLNND